MEKWSYTEPYAHYSRKLRKSTLKSNKIVATAPVGLSGGFGFGAEGLATPAAGGVKFERFETTQRICMLNIAISAKGGKTYRFRRCNG